MKVVILGGTGLLSSAITEKCLEEGHKVIHFNRGKTKTKYDVEKICGNRYEKDELAKVLSFKPDVVIDMLCFNEDHAKLSIDIFKGQILQYIYCSTSCVYTPILEKKILSEESDTNPITNYGKGKLSGEVCFFKAMEEKFFNVTVFRPGHVFGKDFLVSNLSFGGLYVLNRMLHNQDIVLTEGGEREFQACHADNIGLAFAKSCGNEATFGGTYNIAGEEVFTWNELYEIEKRFLNSNSRIVYKLAEEIIDIDRQNLDFLNTYTKYNWHQSLEKIKKEICGYEYLVNFNKGFKKFIYENEEAINNCHIEDDLYAKILM